MGRTSKFIIMYSCSKRFVVKDVGNDVVLSVMFFLEGAVTSITILTFMVTVSLCSLSITTFLLDLIREFIFYGCIRIS